MKDPYWLNYRSRAMFASNLTLSLRFKITSVNKYLKWELGQTLGALYTHTHTHLYIRL